MNADMAETMQLPPCDQVGFVVRDLESALTLYTPMFGPFKILDTGEYTWDYRGQQEPSALRIAFGSSGDLEIELIQWVAGKTPHKEFLDAGREGMHHLRFRVDSLEDAIERAQPFGYQSIWQTRFGEGLAAAYLERKGDPLLIEFFENLHD